MNIGRLDTVVTVQNFTTARDSYGQAIQTWADWKTPWCTVTFESGNEREEQERRTATTVVKFTFRSYDIEGITPDYRIQYNGDNYNILDILDFGRKNYTTVKTEKKY